MKMLHNIKLAAKQIRQAMETPGKVLLHLHPNPDPDSMGSVLAMRSVLLQWGHQVTVIAGDSPKPAELRSLPDYDLIVQQSFGETDLSSFQYYLSLDSADSSQITKLQAVEFPEHMKVIVIDHHHSNTGYGDLTLLIPDAPATAEIIYDLCQEWKIKVLPSMALQLWMGLFGDTGGFKYPSTTAHTLEIAAHLARINPSFTQMVFEYENNHTPSRLIFEGLALRNLHKFYHDQMVLSVVRYQELRENSIDPFAISTSDIANKIKSVVGWNLALALVEYKPEQIRISLRTRNAEDFPVSRLAVASKHGGGHKAAGGIKLNMDVDEAISYLVTLAKECYPQLEGQQIV